ncbi:MAG: hypothetical protein US81_C0020G0005 [Parcubacteria group bacterium GW2011_GWE2_38_18]|nr:MAG: hypothetical protein US81_C0020G0005 [Parcubacteria group bacterium GW2011_GWE2_38_18]
MGCESQAFTSCLQESAPGEDVSRIGILADVDRVLGDRLDAGTVCTFVIPAVDAYLGVQHVPVVYLVVVAVVHRRRGGIQGKGAGNGRRACRIVGNGVCVQPGDVEGNVGVGTVHGIDLEGFQQGAVLFFGGRDQQTVLTNVGGDLGDVNVADDGLVGVHIIPSGIRVRNGNAQHESDKSREDSLFLHHSSSCIQESWNSWKDRK